MLFNSPEFAVFFPIVTLLYFLLPTKLRAPMLLAASCWFYMAFIPKYILILIFVIGFDYTAGILIEGAQGAKRRWLLISSLCVNIGTLGFFKYFNFVNDNLAAVLGSLGMHDPVSKLQIILPIGLSFHTFQSMSYTIEVYRGRFKAERSLLHFALYVMYYPQLVAGPIERPQNLLHQFREEHKFDKARFADGLRLMATGLFKKIVIADRAAILVNAVYAKPDHYSAGQLLVATWFFAVQIYCDFAGYSEIARGASRIMGMEVMRNFNSPYLATSIADFWRRWHISLSTWFRDYVYIPMGGNRCSADRVCFNLAVVFLVSGFWHGANWTYIVWGALHGFFFIVYVLSEGWRGRVVAALGWQDRPALKLLSWLLTFNLICVTWIFFRAKNLADAWLIVRHIFTGFVPVTGSDPHMGLDGTQTGMVLALMFVLFLSEWLGRKQPVWERIDTLPQWWRWSAYYGFGVAFVVLLILTPDHTPQPFIYFQF